MKYLFPLVFPASTATAQLQGEWHGTFPEGEQYRFAFSDDTFTMTLIAELSADVLEVTLETLVKESYTRQQRTACPFSRTAPQKIPVNGVDAETI